MNARARIELIAAVRRWARVARAGSPGAGVIADYDDDEIINSGVDSIEDAKALASMLDDAEEANP